MPVTPEQKINELLAAFAQAGPEERNQLYIELSRLNRQKVLSDRRGWNREEWMQVPIVDYIQPGLPPGNIEELVKLFLHLAVEGADQVAVARAGELHFVGLFRFSVEDDRTVLSLTCPYEEPRRLMKATWNSAADRDRLMARAFRPLDLKCQFIEGTTVPIVFSFSPTSDNVLLMNLNHFSNPDQFLVPAYCRTTSGFLNFVGSTIIKNSNTTIVDNVEAVMNKGLDEWFRWLYCATETGVSFDPDLLLVRRSNPEEWIYDYNG